VADYGHAVGVLNFLTPEAESHKKGLCVPGILTLTSGTEGKVNGESRNGRSK